MKRILLVKTSSLGDVIHNLPIVTDILQHHPKAQIDWVVEEGFAEIPKLHPNVNHIITVAIRRWRKNLLCKKTWHEISEFKQQVSKKPYDYIIDTQGLIKSAVMSSFADGIKYGFDQDSARESLASFFYDKKFHVNRNQHAVERNRELASRAFNYKDPNSAPNYGIDQLALNIEFRLPKDFIIGLHGTSKASKLWPTILWVELARELSKAQLRLVLPWASQEEHQRALQIAQNQNNVMVLPKLSISQLAYIISQSKAAVGVDTGLSHLSTAISIPTVAIYTDTNPARTGVMASINGKAVNLGGIKQTPSVTSVTDALQNLIAIS